MIRDGSSDSFVAEGEPRRIKPRGVLPEETTKACPSFKEETNKTDPLKEPERDTSRPSSLISSFFTLGIWRSASERLPCGGLSGSSDLTDLSRCR